MLWDNLLNNHGVLTVKPKAAGGEAVALVGQGALSDFALSVLAGNVSDQGFDQRLNAYSHEDELLPAYDRNPGTDRTSDRSRFALSKNGRRLAWIDFLSDSPGSWKWYVHVFDLERGSYLPPTEIDSNYDRLVWTNASTVVATSGSTSARAEWVDVTRGVVTRKSPPLCFATPLGRSGALVGAVITDPLSARCDR